VALLGLLVYWMPPELTRSVVSFAALLNIIIIGRIDEYTQYSATYLAICATLSSRDALHKFWQ
jgi:hypothetical protein